MAYPVPSRTPVDTEVSYEDRLDLLNFASYVLARWRLVALTCLVALCAAGVGSFIMPTKYTATATLLIEPPAGQDPRGATAISPVYVESLKTYERFALSSTLFSRALDELGLRKAYQGSSVESLKKSVLRVTKPRDMKILEINATLPDPVKAQALAKFMAEGTVRLSGMVDQRSQADLTDQARKQLEEARMRSDTAEKARNNFLASDPTEPLEAEIRNGTEQKLRLQNELTEARIDLADYDARMRSASPQDQDPRDAGRMREQIAASKARTAQIEQSDRELGQSLSSKGLILEKRKHQREVLDLERQSARAQYELATTRYNETLASAAFRSERLEIVDPGTVPERPSSPNIPLNLVIAFFGGLLSSLAFVTFGFSVKRLRASSGRSAYYNR
ncbi:MAG: GumC family protein [Bryobacteraceae bacterium]